MSVLIPGAVAGPYNATYGGLDLGCSQNGFTVRATIEKELITCDTYGDTVIEDVYRGGNLFVQFEGLEWGKAAQQDAFWPIGTFGEMGVVGRLGTNYGKILQLTARSGTTATNNPSALTFQVAVMAEGQNSEVLYAARLRRAPILFRIYPFLDENDNKEKWFRAVF